MSPDGEQVRLGGRGCAVVRPQRDGAWRIAADAWQAGPELPAEGLALTLAGCGHHGPFRLSDLFL